MATKKKINGITIILKRYDNLENNWTKISNDVYKITNGNEFKIYSYLCMNYNKELQYAFPSLTKIAEDCNIGRTTVKKCIKSLEDKDLIRIIKFDEKTSKYANNCYVVFYPIIVKNELEEKREQERENEISKKIEEASNEVVDKIRTIEVEDNIDSSEEDE